MRNWQLALFAFVAVTCAPNAPNRQPSQPDRSAELLRTDVNAQRPKQAPTPTPWMLGCFELTLEENLQATPSTRFEFTRTIKTRAGHEAYRVRSLDAGLPEQMWSWWPLSDSQLQVELINSFGDGGWEFRLEQQSDGLAGDLRVLGSSPPLRSDPTRATFARIPCP